MQSNNPKAPVNIEVMEHLFYELGHDVFEKGSCFKDVFGSFIPVGHLNDILRDFAGDWVMRVCNFETGKHPATEEAAQSVPHTLVPTKIVDEFIGIAWGECEGTCIGVCDDFQPENGGCCAR